MLEGSGLLPFRYLYMGINTTSSNIALPTSRLIERLKQRGQIRSAGAAELTVAGTASERGRRPGRAWRWARLFHRLSEEWFRQFVAWSYQLRGHVVLYDRHFVFDFAEASTVRPDTLERRVHRWLLRHTYPRPHLVILLDAPADVLYARKRESTVEELERRRQALLREGARSRGFVRIDATRPLPDVYADVVSHIKRHWRLADPRVDAERALDLPNSAADTRLPTGGATSVAAGR
jgi:hypothetical protein